MRIQGLDFLNQQIHSWVPVSVCLSVLTVKVLIFLGNGLEGRLEAVESQFETVIGIWDAFNAIKVNGSYLRTIN